jgi:hypothetical protein
MNIELCATADCEEDVERWFAALTVALSEGDPTTASNSMRILARHGWVVSYIGTLPTTLRQRDDAAFWFTTLDLVTAHGKTWEAAKVQKKLAALGWLVSRITRSTDPS